MFDIVVCFNIIKLCALYFFSSCYPHEQLKPTTTHLQQENNNQLDTHKKKAEIF